MSVAGYSTTPLAKKLGIVEGCSVVLLGPPEGLDLELPERTRVSRRLRGSADVVVAFVRSGSQLDKRFERLAAAVFPAGGLWVAWPKRSSGMATDLSDHAVRALAIEHGLVDNKVCAINEVWTALRVVWRRENRS